MPDEPKQINFTIVPDDGGDSPRTYANFCSIAHTPFDQAKCASPLPRSFGWADGSAYVNHVALVRKSRGAEVPATLSDVSGVAGSY